MFTIKKYKEKDFEMLKSWWDKQKEIAPTKDMLPLESTFIIYIKDDPVASMCLYYTNIKEYCYVECFIGNPEHKTVARQEASITLFNHLCKEAKKRGYKKVVWLSPSKALTRYYRARGFTQTLKNVDTFCKVL